MIAILLATYNGEDYLKKQLDSLIYQTVQDFVVYINDDCSTDNTLAIAMHYVTKYPEQFFVTQNNRNSGSAKHNFLKLMVFHTEDYIMLCDQDDVWMPDKIEKTFRKIRALENSLGKQTPLLVYTDLQVVDQSLQPIASSYRQYMDSNFNRVSLHHTIIQNTVTGCTAMYNRSTAQLLHTNPDFTVMHDWWLLMVVSAFGKVEALDDTTVLYRQHRTNEIGAKDVKSVSYILNRLLHSQAMVEAVDETYLQAESFLKVYDEELSEINKNLLTTYCTIPHLSKCKRIYMLFKLKTFKNGFTRRMAQILFI